MKRWIEKIREIIYPHILWVYASIPISLLLLVCKFYFHWTSLWISIPIYLFSLYVFVICSFSIPQIVSEIYTFLSRNKYLHMFMEDVNVRMFVTLYLNSLITTLFAAMNAINGLQYESDWLLAISCYYLVLTATRFYLLTHVNRQEVKKNSLSMGESLLDEFKKYKMTGYFMIVLLVPIIWILLQMIEANRSYTYSGFMLYVMAAFTLYSWGMVLYGQMMYGKIDNPVLTCNRVIAVAAACMSLLAVETAFLNNIDTGSELITREVIISLTGFVICLTLFGIGVHMVNRARGILSLNYVPRRYREKQSLSVRIKNMKTSYAKDREAYEQYFQDRFEVNSENLKVSSKRN